MKKRYHLERLWEHQGLPCAAIMTHMGSRCGYVGVPMQNRLYGYNYDARLLVAKETKQLIEDTPVDFNNDPLGTVVAAAHWDKPGVAVHTLLHAHGGITYSNGGGLSKYPVITQHIWWFGFNCGHYGDSRDKDQAEAYGLDVFRSEFDFEEGIVQTQQYVEDNCIALAEQLLEYNLFPIKDECQISQTQPFIS